jgi:hypothetical protein
MLLLAAALRDQAEGCIPPHLESRDQLGRPEVTTGQVLLSATH